MSGAQIKGIAGTSASFRWGEQWAYEEGTHSPIRFTFWNFNDVVDNSCKLNGVGSGPKRYENPFACAGSLRQMVEDAVELIDDIIQ
eukprot:5305903-Pyramimonas_sp.AAC.1